MKQPVTYSPLFNSASTTQQLYCQSSKSMQQVTDESIALTCTSPPYWNAIDYKAHAKGKDGEWYRDGEYKVLGNTFDDYLANLQSIFVEVKKKTLPGGFCAIVVGTVLDKGRHLPIPMLLTQQLLAVGWQFHQDIVWNKVTGGVKRAGSFIQSPLAGNYYPNIMTEYILVFRKEGDKRRGTEQEVEIDELFTRDIANNVWHIAPVPPRRINHPCPFPEEIARRLVLLYSLPGDTVLDPFMGSGQTAVAAKRTGRHCIGYDIENKYVLLARERVVTMPSKRSNNLIPQVRKIPVCL